MTLFVISIYLIIGFAIAASSLKGILDAKCNRNSEGLERFTSLYEATEEDIHKASWSVIPFITILWLPIIILGLIASLLSLS